MTTKDKFLLVKKDNQQHFANSIESGSRYSNLNLNQSFKTPILIPVQSPSKLDNNKNDDISTRESSTKSDSFNDKNNVGEKFDSIKNAKQIFPVSTFVIQNPFEFPRQQNDKMPDPEVSQFIAFQQLFNPNAAASNIDSQQIVNIVPPQPQQPPPQPPPPPSAAVLQQRHQLNPIRNYDTYEYQLQSCAAFNKRLISQRRRPYPFFGQQNGIDQRPMTDFVRDISDRCPTQNSNEVYRYTAQKWKANSKVSFDSVEFKYILGTDPSLKAAVDHLMNPEQSNIPWPTEVSNDSFLTPKSTGGRKNSQRVEVEDFEQDDGERDHTDEEDWVEKKPKRKRNAPYKAQTAKRGSGVANLAIGPDGIDPRQHVCHECGARYKSRPGLVYHRKHAHENL